MTYTPSLELDFDEIFNEFSIGCLPCVQPDEDGEPCNTDATWLDTEEHQHLCDDHVSEAWQYKIKRQRKLLDAWGRPIMGISEYATTAEVKLIDGTVLEGSVRVRHLDWMTIVHNETHINVQRRHIVTVISKHKDGGEED